MEEDNEGNHYIITILKHSRLNRQEVGVLELSRRFNRVTMSNIFISNLVFQSDGIF
jgi:hypothetical protein